MSISSGFFKTKKKKIRKRNVAYSTRYFYMNSHGIFGFEELKLLPNVLVSITTEASFIAGVEGKPTKLSLAKALNEVICETLFGEELCFLSEVIILSVVDVGLVLHFVVLPKPGPHVTENSPVVFLSESK